MLAMKKTSNKKPVETTTLILPSSEVLSKTQSQEWAQKLARIQDDIVRLSAPLPDRLPFFLGQHFTRYKDGANYHFIHLPLFYKETITGSLWYTSTACDLSLELFSDEQARSAFAQYVKAHLDKASYATTRYNFDTQGNYGKVIMAHKDFSMDRQVLEDQGLRKVYQSEMTKIDFIYAERALTLIKEKVEDYLKWSSMQVFS